MMVEETLLKTTQTHVKKHMNFGMMKKTKYTAKKHINIKIIILGGLKKQQQTG